MSYESDVVDAILAHVTATIPTATTRNALLTYFVDPETVRGDDFPFWQGYGVTAQSASINYGQKLTEYNVEFFGLRGPDDGDTLHSDVDNVIAAVEADDELGGLATRIYAAENGVDAVTKRERLTYAGLVFIVQRFE